MQYEPAHVAPIGMLVLRVWRGPAFRARMTIPKRTGPDEVIYFSDPDELLFVVRAFLADVADSDHGDELSS